MQAAGIRGRVRRRYKCTTMSDHDQPVAPNILDRKFDPVAPNQSWVGDVTELVTNDGKLYLAVVLDLFSRFAIGWALSAVNEPAPRDQGARDGAPAPLPGSRPGPPLGPREPKGELLEKAELQARFRRKLDRAFEDPSLLHALDWSGMRAVLDVLRRAFENG